MLRLLLLLTGLLLLIALQFISPISTTWQFLIFLTGIITLGIPHGAADLLIAIQSAKSEKKPFSKFNFFINYLLRIILFGLVLYFFSGWGVLFFIVFAAYHFGESDLHILNTNTIAGKVLVCSYGLVILSVILLSNAEELQSLIQQSGMPIVNVDILKWVIKNHNLILSCSMIYFFGSVFFYFLQHKNDPPVSDSFLLQFALLVFILYNMPLLTGFTFYFVVWHSILSLQNIITYLQAGIKYSAGQIIKQISIYSALAIAGIMISGAAGFIFINNESVLIYVFLGLAALTVPHMQVMHDMYNKMRN